MNLYLIWSIEHSAWWRPREAGYTRLITEAGLFHERRALEIVKQANLVAFHECMIPIECTGLAELEDWKSS